MTYKHLATTLAILLATPVLLFAQEGFKGEKPPNPSLDRRSHPTAPRPTPRRSSPADNTRPATDPFEDALAAGNSALDTKNYDGALAQYRRAIALNPNDARAYYGLGNAYFYQQRYADAVEPYRQAIALNSNDAVLHYYLGITYDHLPRRQEAIAEFQSTVRIDPTLARGYQALGQEYFALRRYEEAVEQLQEALRRDSSLSTAYVWLGASYDGLKRYDEAIQWLERARQVDPMDFYVYLILGNVYVGQKRYAEAVQEYRHAITLKRDLTDAHYGLGVAYLWMNNRTGATEEYQALLSLDSKLASQLKEQLDNLAKRDDADSARRQEIERARIDSRSLSKEQLYQAWFNNRQSNEDAAYAYAKEYLQRYSADNDQYTAFLNKYVTAYESIHPQDR